MNLCMTMESGFNTKGAKVMKGTKFGFFSYDGLRVRLFLVEKAWARM
jgi:hypothetical protein